MRKLETIGGIIVVLLLVVIGTIWFTQTQPLGKASSQFASYASDLIGTKSGTTTTGVAFAASTTREYVIKTGGLINSASFTFKPTATPGPTGLVNLQFYASNDDYCDTATTTSSLDSVIMSEINWFDIGTHIVNLAGSQTLNDATSTVVWAPTGTAHGKEVTLNNLNYECLKVGVTASSTTLWAQVKTK